MSTTTPAQQRSSTESTNPLLTTSTMTLAPRSSRPVSIAPSINSVLSDATTITGPNHAQRGFETREAYLAALHEFAESKSYMDVHEHTVLGWYGTKTPEDYKQQLGLREERRRRKESERRADRKERRRTLAGVEEGNEGVGGVTSEDVGGEAGNGLSKGETKKSLKEGPIRRLTRVLSGGRRSTLA